MSDIAARVLSTGLKAKLAPLLRLQASDNDGERANASAAIGRLLKNNGLDWHDLTDALLAEPKAPEPPQPNPGATTWKRSTGAIDLTRDELLGLLDIVEQKSPFLPIKSAGLISSLRSRAWRPTVHLSEKQWSWLQDLMENVVGV
jgi:hypothetical protein